MSVASLLEEYGAELAPDENLIEVWLVEATLDERALEMFTDAASVGGGAVAGVGGAQPMPLHGLTSFFVIDFFNFESQATKLLPGLRPEFDFATSYKVSIDDLFLRSLAMEPLTLELCEARNADFELLARAEVSLAPLLGSRPTLVHQRMPLIAARGGVARSVGSIHVEVRMAQPVSELFAVFLERHPAEREAIEDRMRQQMLAGAALGGDAHDPSDLGLSLLPVAGGAKGGVRDSANRAQSNRAAGHAGGDATTTNNDASLHNELEIIVHSASDLPKRTGNEVLPSPWVHYQLLQFQERFTPHRPQTVAPTWDPDVMAFPLATGNEMMQRLRTERIVFTVLDFRSDGERVGGDGTAGPDDLLIGTAELSLMPITEGEPVFERLPVTNDVGRTVGSLRVGARWRHPLRTSRDVGPQALSADELSWILGQYAPRKDGQVDYLAMLRDVEPPVLVEAAAAKLSQFVDRMRLERDDMDAASLLGDLDAATLSQSEFTSRLTQAQCGAAPDELDQLHAYLLKEATAAASSTAGDDDVTTARDRTRPPCARSFPSSVSRRPKPMALPAPLRSPRARSESCARASSTFGAPMATTRSSRRLKSRTLGNSARRACAALTRSARGGSRDPSSRPRCEHSGSSSWESPHRARPSGSNSTMGTATARGSAASVTMTTTTMRMPSSCVRTTPSATRVRRSRRRNSASGASLKRRRSGYGWRRGRTLMRPISGNSSWTLTK